MNLNDLVSFGPDTAYPDLQYLTTALSVESTGADTPPVIFAEALDVTGITRPVLLIPYLIKEHIETNVGPAGLDESAGCTGYDPDACALMVPENGINIVNVVLPTVDPADLPSVPFAGSNLGFPNMSGNTPNTIVNGNEILLEVKGGALPASDDIQTSAVQATFDGFTIELFKADIVRKREVDVVLYEINSTSGTNGNANPVALTVTLQEINEGLELIWMRQANIKMNVSYGPSQQINYDSLADMPYLDPRLPPNTEDGGDNDQELDIWLYGDNPDDDYKDIERITVEIEVDSLPGEKKVILVKDLGKDVDDGNPIDDIQGFTTLGGDEVYMKTDGVGDEFIETLAHELGHTLRIRGDYTQPHHADKLMYYKVTNQTVCRIRRVEWLSAERTEQ